MRYASSILSSALLSLGAAPALAQPQLDALSRDAQHLADCVKALDAKCVVALSDLESYQLMSVPGFNFAQAQTRFFAWAKQTGSKYSQFEVAMPRHVYADAGRKYAFVPYVEAGEMDGHRFQDKSYLVAFSVDGGKSWKFFEGAHVTPDNIRKLIPHYQGQPLPPVDQ